MVNLFCFMVPLSEQRKEGTTSVQCVPLGRARLILEQVAEKHEMSVNQMLKKCKQFEFVAARREAIWRLHAELEWSLKRISRVMHCNHTTVLYALRKVWEERAAA